MSLLKSLSVGSSAVLLTALLGGCISLDERSTDTSMNTSTNTSTENVTTVTATVTSTAMAEPGTAVPTSTSAPTTAPVQCNLDPRTSDFGPHLAQSRTPVGELGRVS